MTDKNTTDKNGSNLGKEEPEIEITPAMIEAGIHEWDGIDFAEICLEPDKAVCWIYEAMEIAKRAANKSD